MSPCKFDMFLILYFKCFFSLSMNSKICNFKYTNVDEFNLNSNLASQLNQDSCISILQQNMQGMNDFTKFDDFSLFFLSELQSSIDIIVLPETWINNENEKYYNIPGFKQINSSRVGRRGGGLIIFFQSKFDVEIIEKNNSQLSFQFIRISIKLSQVERLRICAVYRPPVADMKEFRNFFESVKENYARSVTIILGDINIAINKSNTIVTDYKNLLASSSFEVINTFKTRPASEIILDHVICYTSNFLEITNSTIFNDISDHIPILSKFTIKSKKQKLKLSKNILNHTHFHQEFYRFLENLTLEADPKHTY
ncbi:uncharacterized protein LOC134284761 [Aedes albopictus]|uniref:Endonuclease/exonuclease/phosphatase domain-containing protein n=1 Tax=Aedes albopictus TaxID=7160 RepID=A0ABM1Z1P5_AEDAL